MNSQVLKEKYVELYEEHKNTLPGKNIPWLENLREEAIDQFKQSGLPDTSVEEWNVYPYKNLTNNYFSITGKENIDLSELEIKDEDCIARLILHNGSVVKIEADKLPERVLINSLSYFIENHPEIIEGNINPVNKHFETRLSNIIDPKSQGIVSLNTAFHKDGAVIYIEKNIEVSGYIEIINLSNNKTNLMNHIRSLIILEAGAKCKVIEKNIGLYSEDNLLFSSSVTDINLSKDSSLSFMRLIAGNLNNTNVNCTHADIEENAIFNSTSFVCSKGDARDEIRVNLNGTNSLVNLNGLLLGLEKSKNELLTKVRHIAKSTNSNQNVRAILNDKARGSFQGKIRVEKKADDTVANMSGKSLLLNQSARVNSKPELEILADDVSCSHGVTVGSLDPEQLFYLSSRGISNNEAKKMLIAAFSEIVFENLDVSFKKNAQKFMVDYYGTY